VVKSFNQIYTKAHKNCQREKCGKVQFKSSKTLASYRFINFAEMCVHKKLFLSLSDGSVAAAVVGGVNKLLKYMVNIHKKTDDMNLV